MIIYINSEPFDIKEGDELYAYHFCDGCSEIGIEYDDPEKRGRFSTLTSPQEKSFASIIKDLL